MIADKREFSRGLLLMAAFVVVLILMFVPIFGGKNALEYSDDLYNSISKQSAYYIPATREKVDAFGSKPVAMALDVGESDIAETARLFEAAGAATRTEGGMLNVEGDIAAILKSCVEDADAMFGNQGKELEDQYGFDARRALYHWWVALKAMDKNLGKQKLFKEAKLADTVNKKAVEPAYNYYGIEPQKLSERLGVVLFSLVFYVVYTLWYGFGIMFLLEGWGMRLEH